MQTRSVATRVADQTRDISLRVSAVDTAARSIRATIATEAAVAVADWQRGVVDEVLRADGLDAPAQTPLLLDHRRAVEHQVGSCRDIRAESDHVSAALHFADGTPEADRAWQLVSGKHLTDVSVGYQVLEHTDIAPGRRKTVAGREYTASAHRTLRVATGWRLREVSLTPLGADSRATIQRSDKGVSMPPVITREPVDSVPAIVSAGFDQPNARMADIAGHALRHLGREVPENDGDLVRAAVSTPSIADAFSTAVGDQFLRGFDGEDDSTRGWVLETGLPNFRPASLLLTAEGDRLVRVPRGGEADSASFAIAENAIQLLRFGKQLVIDEQDLADARLFPIGEAARELGRMAARLRIDLVYSTLLKNPVLHDSIALFDAGDHHNYGSGGDSVMGDVGLAGGLAAMGAQTILDTAGDPVHLNLTGRYIICPPDNYAAARAAARKLALYDGRDLEVRSESRLSAAGLVDPVSGDGYAGTATNWLLAGSAERWPSIILAGLNGPPRPRIRRSELTEGQWGLAWDVSLDAACAAVHWANVYFSAGA